MEFTLTDEQKMIYEQLRAFAEKEMLPTALERDEKQIFDQELWKKMGEMGILGMPFPTEYGGQGLGALTTCVAGVALGRGGADGGMTMTWGAHSILCGVPIWRRGNEEQRKKFLPKICSGEWIGGMGMTEPNAGSDATHIQTRAVKKGNKFILNGSKTFITNGPYGHQFIVIAATAPEKKTFGISTFIVESDSKGFSAGKHMNKLGQRTSPTSELFFDDCEVPEENLLDELDMGFVNVARTILAWERSCLLAPAVGGMESALDKCTKYAKTRVQFKRPISDFQAIQHMLVDLKVFYEVGKNLVYRTAWMIDQGRELEAMQQAAIGKYFVSEAAIKTAYLAIQIHGGYGYIKEYPVERGFRDSRIATIGGGTSEIQKSIIARTLMSFGS
jgi:alkylation response protein AidB-like acyl-CoA dehydrogenase